MHLKQLKLAGFKSFVDPTVVHFPSQLVAVVGPNGCGKSNIIDAVRWVMGESSAKNLRGESMADVIFNGSSNRKPVGQALVELVFDNSLGRLAGPFASYGEIAVKRVVTRDGDSSYYLNNSKCRRKDITDIFLGTGAGAKGYSIIGQGTISRLIEAKPEELRAFLEEAAGVSKYKERRRETLQRITQTRENLTRVADIRDELDKQLQRLERQAKSAERYTTLKQDEKLCRAEILALKWQEFTDKQTVKQHELQDLAVRYEQQQSLVTGSNKERTIINEKLLDANDKAQQIQAVFYQTGTEIARLEEVIHQQDREKKRLEHDQQQMQNDRQIAVAQIQQDKQQLEASQLNSHALQEQCSVITDDLHQKEQQEKETQEEYANWELRGRDIQAAINTTKSELQVTALNLQHVEQRQQQAILRLEKIATEQSSFSLAELQSAKQELETKQNTLTATLRFDEEQLKYATESSNQLRLQLKDAEQQLHQLQDEFCQLNTEYAALSAAQKAARQANKKNKGIKEWINKPRLMDVLHIETVWQFAAEMVLGDSLHAYVLEQFEELWPQWESCQQQGESVVTLRKILSGNHDFPRLVDKIKGDIPTSLPNLDYIYAADNLEDAISWLSQLQEYESVVTTNGLWLGKGWVKLANTDWQDDSGLLVRQQQITNLAAAVGLSQIKIDTVKELRDQYHGKLQLSLSQVELFQLNLNASNEAMRVNFAALSMNDQSFNHAQKLMATMAVEGDELKRVLDDSAAKQSGLQERLHVLDNQYGEYDQQHQHFVYEKNTWSDSLAVKRTLREEARTILHQAELESDREMTKVQQLTDRIAREQERLGILQERLEQVALLCAQSADPENELQNQLAVQLMKHSEIEQQLTLSREHSVQLRMQIDESERFTLNHDLEVKKVQELISQARMQEQALAVRASSVQESLDESGLQAQLILEHIPLGISQVMREDELLVIAEKIKRLGPINLAAIEEFSKEKQRKTYLDEQHDDLSQALLTLESAIEKMDQETRLRLENTFDEVNTSFKALFPRLFGGGRAQLELTCDNLLEAGIVVMAQPPGKRNSTIHLLSGGEKAMTAVALVFAIFQLNPSPFCMLDEVDAPLDDVNVGRFCDLVKEMSQFVQFLFITHNKVTMELADHLIGVTMREPGVSRLVAVDVKQALTME